MDKSMKKQVARWNKMGLDEMPNAPIHHAKAKLRRLLVHFGGTNETSRHLGVTPRHLVRLRRGEQTGGGSFWELVELRDKILWLFENEKIDANAASLLLEIAPKRKHIPTP